MNKFDNYKETGIEWIGKIPSDWQLSTAGKFFIERTEKVDDVTYPPLSVTMSGIVDQLSEVAKTNDGDNRKLVKKGDFVINSRSDRKGSSGISPRDGSVSLINIVLEPKELNPHYIQYLLKSYYFKEEFFRNGKGIHWDLWTTRWDQFKNICIPIPSNEEQKLISHYLDKKTKLIDKLIDKIQKKIELLNEQRSSLINQSVTKGLNPKIEMKDSGSELIKHIPIHWIKTKIKYIAEIFGRIGYRGYTTEDIVDEADGVITISPGNIFEDKFSTKNSTYLSWEKYFESPEIQIFTNDIVIVKTGSTIGKSSIIPDDVPEMTINPQLIVLKNLKIDPKFLYYQTLCKFVKDSFYVEQTGSSTPTISQEKIKDFIILETSIQEQREIATFLDKQTKLIDNFLSNEKKRIDLLKEYRQCLIFEVVTGKIKVLENMI